MTYRDPLGFESPGPESEIFHAPRKISYYSRLVNHKQRAFVAHYLATLNAAEAARRAGYSERRAKQTGSELLANPGVRAAIDAEFAGLIPSAAESLARIGARARVDIADIAAELGHEGLREAREAGLDTRVIHKLRFHPPREAGEKPTLAQVEVYNAQLADEALLKAAGRLEERLRVVVEDRLEAETDRLGNALRAEFGGAEDAEILARIQRALEVADEPTG